MQQSTNYNFNLPEGTDLVNLLTQLIPNWSSLDSILRGIQNDTFENATETVALGVHALTRLDSNAKLIKWVATANYTAGETFTIDGTPIAASTPSGNTLATGAYVSGAIVIAAINSDETAMTIFVTGTNVASDSERLGGELPSYYATDQDMETAKQNIEDLDNLMGNTSISAIGDGTCTGAISALNADLNNSVILDVTIDTTKITPNTADYFKKISNLVYVQLSGAIIAPLNAFVPHQLGTINTYKPIQDLLAPVVFATGATGALLINTSGQISVVPNGNIQSGDTMYCQAFYLLK